MFFCLLQAGERNFFTAYSRNPEHIKKLTPVFVSRFKGGTVMSSPYRARTYWK